MKERLDQFDRHRDRWPILQIEQHLAVFIGDSRAAQLREQRPHQSNFPRATIATPSHFNQDNSDDAKFHVTQAPSPTSTSGGNIPNQSARRLVSSQISRMV